METNFYDKDKALRIVMKKMIEQAEQMKLSEGFTDRLMERIRREERAKKMALRRRRIGFAVGIAAAVALLVGIALHVMHREEDASQQVAKTVEDVKSRDERVGLRGESKELSDERLELSMEREKLVAYAPARIDKVMEEEQAEKEEAEVVGLEGLTQQLENGDRNVCWILIPNTPFALKYSLTWDSDDEGATKANVASVECVTIEENDTVLIKSPSGEIRKGSMYVYEREKKENDFVYVQDGRLLSADVRIYYKKAFLNADGQTYSYMDALALLDYPTCSLCMKD